MRHSGLLLLLCFSLAFIVVFDARSQDRRLVVVSPRVGAEIDSVERSTYDLFHSIPDFQSASFYQNPDSTFWVSMLMRSPEGNLRDSLYTISYSVLRQCAEWIEHYDEIKKGTYLLGSTEPIIMYEDGSPIKLPAKTKTESASHSFRYSVGRLPLAQNVSGLERPMFQTIHMVFGFGLGFPHLSDLQSLTGSGSDIALPVSISIEIPFQEELGFSLFTGWGFALGGAGGGTLATFSISLLDRLEPSGIISPILGVGAGYTEYSFSNGSVGGVEISAAKSYPVLAFGLNLVGQRLDVLCIIPFAAGLTTSFESRTYSISPAESQIVVLFSL